MAGDDKQRALDTAIAQVEKEFGHGAIMKLGEAARQRMSIGAIPTGSLSLDIALGVGGVPRGRVTELFGAESSGKSTLALHVIAQAQQAGGAVAYVDAEHVLDPEYAQRQCGVDVENLYISQPDTGEQALQIVEYLVRSGAVDVIVVDSVAALVPRTELEGDMGEPQVGVQARLMSQGLRKITSILLRSRSSVLFINQLREKVGVTFGNPETTPGGRALKFYSSVRIDLRRIESLKHGSEVVGNRVRARVVKNKVAPPFRTAEFELLFDGGISREGDLLELGVNTGMLRKSGAFYSYGDTRLGQGKEQAREYLREHGDVAVTLEQEIRDRLGSPQPVAAGAGAAGNSE